MKHIFEMGVIRKFDFRQDWKFCWDLSNVISGRNWLFMCRVFFKWYFIPFRKLWAALTIVDGSPFDHQYIFGKWNVGKRCIIQYFHQTLLGTDGRPSWEQGCILSNWKLISNWSSIKENETEAYDIKPNDAQFYQGNHNKRCIMLSRKSNQKIHNVINKIIPSNAWCYQEFIPNHV